ncbi:transmembrane 14 domain-containing protein [Histoplasma ohiense]|nr:transmembrane 14 domain-containing protein [Histoplasma ohiense (nom. inval.)]
MLSSQSVHNSAAALSLLTSCGGIIGYARTGSIASIAAGLCVGAIYAFSYFRFHSQQPHGEELSLIASVMLAGSSIPRALKTRKLVPVSLSLMATYGLIVFWLAYKGKRVS